MNVARILADRVSNAAAGDVRWSPATSVWIRGMTLATISLAPFYFSWGAVVLFVVPSAITLCFGHSVWIPRPLVLKSFDCPRWSEYLCVYLATVVGTAGLLAMVRILDSRDWAQRQAKCHGYFSQRKNFWHDAWWAFHCEIFLTHPPLFVSSPVLRKIGSTASSNKRGCCSNALGTRVDRDRRDCLGSLGGLRARDRLRYRTLARRAISRIA